jgi:hypothetical protein
MLFDEQEWEKPFGPSLAWTIREVLVGSVGWMEGLTLQGIDNL